MNKLDRLKELGELYKSGIISETEFKALKKELLASAKEKSPPTKKNVEEKKRNSSPPVEKNKKEPKPSKIEENITNATPLRPQEKTEKQNKEPNISFQDSDEFWETFHASLESPISYWRDYKNCTVSEWLDQCSNNQFSSYLNIIFDNSPLLKGEYPVVWSDDTGMILTNYRLFVNMDAGLFIIPLCNLSSYNAVRDEKVRIKYNVRGESQHIDVYAWILREYIDSAKNAKQWMILSDQEKEYLQYGFYDLKSRFNLNPPKVSYDYSRYDGNTKNKSKKGKRSRSRNNEKLNFSPLLKAFILFIVSLVLITGLFYLPDQIFAWISSTSRSDNNENVTSKSEESGINIKGQFLNDNVLKDYLVSEGELDFSCSRYGFAVKIKFLNHDKVEVSCVGQEGGWDKKWVTGYTIEELRFWEGRGTNKEFRRAVVLDNGEVFGDKAVVQFMCFSVDPHASKPSFEGKSVSLEDGCSGLSL